jgi:FAD/FMN-containing dehydrogenase
LRRVWPKRYLRSDVYWKMIALENRYHLVSRLEQARGKLPRERLIQDVEIPLERTADFLDWFLREVPVQPVWVCPLKLRPAGPAGAPVAGETPWPLYPLVAGETYVNVGFWSTVPIRPGRADGDVNRDVERVVAEHGGHKSLYSDAYYDEEQFRALYGGAGYAAVKQRYDPGGRLLDLYAKAVMRR